MISQDQVSIIIPHLGATNEEEYALDECWKSLNETVPEIRKLLAINGDELCGHCEDSELMIHSQGQCKAVNAAVATTDTPWIFITNDDMIYPKDWFNKLTGILMGINMCYSPQLVEPRQGAPTFIVEFCGGAGGDFDKQKFLDFADKHAGQGLRKGFNLPFLIRRELWDLIGGYDINYDPWGSNGDSDLEYKIKLAGVQPYQNTNCLVYHFSQTSGTFEPRNQPYWQKNWDYFIQKWGFPRTDDGIWQATFEIPKENKFHPFWEGHYD